MAINDSLKNLGLTFSSATKRRPMLLALIFSLAVVGWVGWMSYQSVIDRPIPAEKISAHRLRVNNSQLQSLTTTISNYQKSNELVAVPPGLFNQPAK